MVEINCSSGVLLHHWSLVIPFLHPQPHRSTKTSLFMCQEENLKHGFSLFLKPAVNTCLWQKALEDDSFPHVGNITSCCFSPVSQRVRSGAHLSGCLPQRGLFLRRPEASPTGLPPLHSCSGMTAKALSHRVGGVVRWKAEWRWCLWLI